MQSPDCDNVAFARNVLRWLSTRESNTVATGGHHVGR
jgi:hypothetical protein